MIRLDKKTYDELKSDIIKEKGYTSTEDFENEVAQKIKDILSKNSDFIEFSKKTLHQIILGEV